MGVFVFIILMIIGLVNVISPETAWYLSEGWKYKDAEPSDFALTMNRVVGTIILVVEIIIIIFNFGSCVSKSSGLNNFNKQFVEVNIERVSITYNFSTTKELNNKQIEEFALIMKSEEVQTVSREERGGSSSGSYSLDADVYFKDGTAASFSTLNNNFDILYVGKYYRLNSSTLANFLVGIAEQDY